MDFLRRFETTRTPTTPHMSTPHGIQPRIYPDFGYQPSPVGRDEVLHPEHSTLPHTQSARTEDQADSMETHMGSMRNTLPHIRSARTGDQDDVRETHSMLPHIMSARTGDQDDVREARSTLPHTSSARTGEQIIFRDTRTRDQDDVFGDTRTREHSDDRNARSRDLQFRLNERPTHEDDRRNSGDRVPTTLATTHRFHARHQALRFRHLMEQIQPSSVLGLFNLRPSRAIRAGQQGNG